MFSQAGDETPTQATGQDGARGPLATTTGRAAGPKPLLLLHHQVSREGVGFDHALALPVRRLEPAAHQAVLALGGVLDRQVDLVAQLAGVRGVAELEGAARVDGEAHDSGDGLGADVAVAGAEA